MLSTMLILAVGFVAFTNGANANFKCVASLYGSGTTSLRLAGWWGTATTFVGSIVALFVSSGRIAAFSGKGIVPDSRLDSSHFITAVAIGGALTSFLATRLGFPVSTTHALVGALLGAGWASGGDVNLAVLFKTILYPLLLSPVIAAIAGALAVVILRTAHLMPDRRTRTLDVCHMLSTGAASFARGLNDTPKIVALMMAVPGMRIDMSFFAVAILIAFGGLMDIRRVAETLGKKITTMNPGEGFAASLVTAILVTTASLHSLPVSTTHVSVGSLFGMGVVTRQAKWRTVLEIVLAWLCTVPCGAAIAAVALKGLSTS